MKLRKEPRRDEGFSLVEVVVSMLIFAVLSSAVVGLVVKTLQTTTKSDNKNAASNLADAKKEFLLGAAWDSVTTGSDTVDADGDPWISSAQGVQYTVQSTVALVPNTDSFCSSDGAELTRKLLRIDVSWPGMSSTDGVTNTTFRRVLQADSASTPGAAAWQLNTPKFSPTGVVSHVGLVGMTASAYQAGVLVATGVSDSTGCVVMSGLDAGKYTLVLDQGGYVGQDNVQRQVTDVTVQAGRVSVPEAVRYAPASSAKLKYVPVAGYDVPKGLTSWSEMSSTFYTGKAGEYSQRGSCSAGQTPTTANCVGNDGTVARLYPQSYSGWVGLCADINADATTKATSQDFTPRWTAADVPQVNMQLGAAQFRLTQVFSSTNWNITATYKNSNGMPESCSGQTLQLGSYVSNQVHKIGLPVGDWTLTATSGLKSSQVDVTVKSTAPTTTATVGVAL